MYDIKKAKATPKARWFEIVTKSCGEFDAKVEPFGNPAFRKLYDQLTRPHQRLKRKNDGELPPSVHEPIMRRCVAETILVDVGRIVADGEPVAFTTALAKELLEEDEAYQGVLQASMELSKTYAVEQEESEGNSESASAGS